VVVRIGKLRRRLLCRRRAHADTHFERRKDVQREPIQQTSALCQGAEGATVAAAAVSTAAAAPAASVASASAPAVTSSTTLAAADTATSAFAS